MEGSILKWSDFFIGRTRALAAVARGEKEQGLSDKLEALRTFAKDRGFTFYLLAIEEAISDLR